MSGKREFLREGLTMAKFVHDNVLPLIGIGFDDNKVPFIVTPYMPMATCARGCVRKPTLRV